MPTWEEFPSHPRLKKLLRQHEDWRVKSCLNLLPSENFSSPAVRQMLSCDLANRYTSHEHYYMGTRYTDQIQAETEDLAKEVFGAKYADVRPISGHSADMIALTALANRGDKIMVVGKDNGGYPGISREGYPKIYELQVPEFPFNRRTFNIDAGTSKRRYRAGTTQRRSFRSESDPLSPPCKSSGRHLPQVGAKVVFDGSHVLGLIAGGQFQDPLREGAGVLIGSTHKSFFGPQGGIILSRPRRGKLRGVVHPAIVDNAHWNRIAAIQVALNEMKRFGRRYAQQVVRNSKALAKALDEHGVKLLGKELGFTQSHQVVVDVPSEAEGFRLARKLEEANIIVDARNQGWDE